MSHQLASQPGKAGQSGNTIIFGQFKTENNAGFYHFSLISMFSFLFQGCIVAAATADRCETKKINEI